MGVNKIAEKEGFRMLANDMVPVLNEVVNIIHSHELQGNVYVSVSPDGCISLSTSESDWELFRMSEKENFKLKCSISEEL